MWLCNCLISSFSLVISGTTYENIKIGSLLLHSCGVWVCTGRSFCQRTRDPTKMNQKVTQNYGHLAIYSNEFLQTESFSVFGCLGGVN